MPAIDQFVVRLFLMELKSTLKPALNQFVVNFKIITQIEVIFML